MSQSTIVTVSGESDSFKQTVVAGEHNFAVDEPKEFGGTDVGPTPYEILLGALGSCIGITVRMYAKRKGWQIDDVLIHLSHQKIHASDCVDCERETGFVDVIRKSVTITGELDDEQKSRLNEIASKCPVHRTLENSVKFMEMD